MHIGSLVFFMERCKLDYFTLVLYIYFEFILLLASIVVVWLMVWRSKRKDQPARSEITQHSLTFFPVYFSCAQWIQKMVLLIGRYFVDFFFQII